MIIETSASLWEDVANFILKEDNWIILTPSRKRQIYKKVSGMCEGCDKDINIHFKTVLEEE
jgi:hypothetical protein